MDFYRQIFKDCPREIEVPEFLRGHTVEVIMLPLTQAQILADARLFDSDDTAEEQNAIIE